MCGVHLFPPDGTTHICLLRKEGEKKNKKVFRSRVWNTNHVYTNWIFQWHPQLCGDDAEQRECHAISTEGTNELQRRVALLFALQIQDLWMLSSSRFLFSTREIRNTNEEKL